MTSAPALPLPAPLPRAHAHPGPATARALWALARPVGGAAILVFLVWRVGTGPFLDGLRQINTHCVVTAFLLGIATTTASAWRWSVTAGGLGLRLPLRTAVADCYRSIFLNATLPGGVLGDVHRAVHHGREVGDVSRGVRAVVWERTTGQVVQSVLALVVLLSFASPVRPAMPLVVAVALAVLAAVVLLGRLLPRAGSSRTARALRTARSDVAAGVLARGVWPRVVAASVVAVVGHVLTFVIAAHAAGVHAGLPVLAPLALLALVVMTVPLNVGGFGPREGVAAWAFASAGLTASLGVTTAVLYGALVLVASLPGAAVLLVRRLRPPAVPPDEPIRPAVEPGAPTGSGVPTWPVVPSTQGAGLG
jgi:glycosyltransferase 2 family protein